MELRHVYQVTITYQVWNVTMVKIHIEHCHSLLALLPKTTCTIFAYQFNKEHCLPGAKGREQL